jgi:hypothetical protein
VSVAGYGRETLGAAEFGLPNPLLAKSHSLGSFATTIGC